MLVNMDSPESRKLTQTSLECDELIEGFFESRWNGIGAIIPTLKDCDYEDTSPEATVKRAKRPSFRRFYGFSNSEKYDGLTNKPFSQMGRSLFL